MTWKKPALKIKKTPGGGKMVSLSQKRRAQVFAMSENNMRLVDIQEDLLKKDGLKISQASLGAWLAKKRVEWRMETTAASIKDVISAAKDLNGGEIDFALESMIKQKLFDFISMDNKPESIAELFRVVLSARKLSLDERKVSILEKKAAAFDDVKKVSESSKTAEEKMAEIDKILIG